MDKVLPAKDSQSGVWT